MFNQRLRCCSISKCSWNNGFHVALLVDDEVIEGHSLWAVGFGRFFVEVDSQSEGGFCSAFDLLQTRGTFFFFAKYEDQFCIEFLEIVSLLLQLDQLPNAVRSPVRSTEHQSDVGVAFF